MALSDYLPFLPRPAPKFVTEAGRPVYGIAAEFESASAVYHAAEVVRDAGFTKWDVYSPYPIHGIEEAMGVRRTILPVIVAFAAFTGIGAALLMQWWMNYIDYPLVVQGKPFDAWEPFTPVVFELGVLFSAFACLIGMLALNGLPRWHHPLFMSERFLGTSDDRLMICIEAEDPKFTAESVHDIRRMLEEAGGRGVELVEEE